MMILNYKMGKYYLPALRKLVGHEPGLRTAIETGQPYNYIITLKDIAQLIPKEEETPEGQPQETGWLYWKDKNIVTNNKVVTLH